MTDPLAATLAPYPQIDRPFEGRTSLFGPARSGMFVSFPVDAVHEPDGPRQHGIVLVSDPQLVLVRWFQPHTYVPSPRIGRIETDWHELVEPDPAALRHSVAEATTSVDSKHPLTTAMRRALVVGACMKAPQRLTTTGSRTRVGKVHTHTLRQLCARRMCVNDETAVSEQDQPPTRAVMTDAGRFVARIVDVALDESLRRSGR